MLTPRHLRSFPNNMDSTHTYLPFIRRMIVKAQARLNASTTPTPTHFDPLIQLTFRLLVQETQRLSRDPFLADWFREGIDKESSSVRLISRASLDA